MIGVDVGQRLDGRPLRVPLEQWSTLLGGLPGSGKSSTLRCVVAGAGLRDDVALVLLDPKRVELPIWRSRATAVAVELDDVTAVLGSLVALLDQRYEAMELAGDLYWPRTALAPQVLVVIDELAELVDSGEGGDKDRERLLRRLLSKGRAAGVIVVAATQRPSADVLSTSVRDLFSLRIAHACATREASTMILGRTEAGFADALPIGAGHEGLAFVLGEGEREPVLARVDWLDPSRARQLAAEVAHLRPGLELPAAVVGVVPPARPWSAPAASGASRSASGNVAVRGAILAAMRAGDVTAPAISRATALRDDLVRAELAALAADGFVVRVNGSMWSLVGVSA